MTEELLLLLLLLLLIGDSNKEILNLLLHLTPYRTQAAYTWANAKRKSLLLSPKHKNVIQEHAKA